MMFQPPNRTYDRYHCSMLLVVDVLNPKSDVSINTREYTSTVLHFNNGNANPHRLNGFK